MSMAESQGAEIVAWTTQTIRLEVTPRQPRALPNDKGDFLPPTSTRCCLPRGRKQATLHARWSRLQASFSIMVSAAIFSYMMSGLACGWCTKTRRLRCPVELRKTRYNEHRVRRSSATSVCLLAHLVRLTAPELIPIPKGGHLPHHRMCSVIAHASLYALSNIEPQHLEKGGCKPSRARLEHLLMAPDAALADLHEASTSHMHGLLLLLLYRLHRRGFRAQDFRT